MIVAVSTIGCAPQLHNLVAQLVGEGHQIWLLVNRRDVTLDYTDADTILRWDLPNLNLYATWNHALTLARKLNEPRLAFLNDDLELAPDALATAAALMTEDPTIAVCGLDYEHRDVTMLRRCTGSYRHHGIGGFAFIVDPARVPDFDEGYEWWGGDEDFLNTAAAQGNHLAIADGCWVTHEGGVSADRNPWTEDAKVRDRERFLHKWGNAW